jgi:hypothetical protein
MQLSVVAMLASTASAQSGSASATTSLFYESRGPLSTTVVAPSATAEATFDPVTVGLSWDADVVSAATIAVVDGPSAVDIVSSATTMSDVRTAVRGTAGVTLDAVELRAGYGYGFEADYRAHRLALGAAIDLYDHASRLDLGYSMSADSVCDLIQVEDAAPAERARLPNSDGCFTAERASRDAWTHSVDLGLVQVLRPDLVVKVQLGLERVEGFQSSPYREVWIGPFAAQEHHPDGRTRGGLSVEARLALPRLDAILRARARGYHDDWDLSAASGEVGWEQRIGAHFRVAVSGRAFTQTAVAFYSDDYANAPRGEFFTGDRELAAMQSLGGVVRVVFDPEAGDDGFVLGPLVDLRAVLALEATQASFSDFHYGEERVPDGGSLLASISLSGEL